MLTLQGKSVNFFLNIQTVNRSNVRERVPGWRNQVEYPIENIAELCMTLSHQCHQTVTAGRSNHHIVAAALLPQQVQSRSLKSNQWWKDTSEEQHGTQTPSPHPAVTRSGGQPSSTNMPCRHRICRVSESRFSKRETTGVFCYSNSLSSGVGAANHGWLQTGTACTE